MASPLRPTAAGDGGARRGVEGACAEGRRGVQGACAEWRAGQTTESGTVSDSNARMAKRSVIPAR